eukprot:scpid37652/ scgid28778/ 
MISPIAKYTVLGIGGLCSCEGRAPCMAASCMHACVAAMQLLLCYLILLSLKVVYIINIIFCRSVLACTCHAARLRYRMKFRARDCCHLRKLFICWSGSYYLIKIIQPTILLRFSSPRQYTSVVYCNFASPLRSWRDFPVGDHGTSPIIVFCMQGVCERERERE